MGSFKYLEEKERRWQKVRQYLKNKNLDALIVIGSRYREPLDRYLTNWVPGCTVIFPSEDEPVLLVPMIPEILALKPHTPMDERPWINDIRPGARGAVIVAIIKEKGLGNGRIGVVGLEGLGVDWEGWIPYKTWNRVLMDLPNCNFQDVTAEFAELILVKTDSEIFHIRRAAQVLEEACKEMLKTVRVGISELEVYSSIQNVLSKNGIYAPKFILRSGPDNISWEDPPWFFGIGNPRVFKPGDVVQAEIFAWSGCLEAQVQMSVAIPPVSEMNYRCAQLARKAYEEGLKHLKPKKKFIEVVNAMEAVLDYPGVWHLTPLIHSMNPHFCIGPTGVRIESLPDIENYKGLGMGRIRGGDIIIQPGMVFELEPNACIGRHRINIGGTVIITEDGCEPLNKIPTEMRIAEG